MRCIPCADAAEFADLVLIIASACSMRLRNLLLPLLLGTLLSGLFFPRLWEGGGFIGGDTYTYFLPQKAFLADRLKAGEFPFWNFLTGHGYPLIGESQTAPLYPVNAVLYRWLDLNTAYVASHLLHYVLAFVAMWWLAVRLGLNRWGAALAAVVYVYGWFPPRACLEWAIIGGVYLPLSLGMLESWLQTGRARYAAGMSLALGLDLLAGHYNLAFFTVLALGMYALARWWMQRHDRRGAPASEPGMPLPTSGLEATSGWLTGILIPAVCVGLGFGLAAPQLAPSWDLKRQSQRTAVNDEFDPGYGNIPPWYLVQVTTPWIWYARDADPDQALNSPGLGRIPSLTNKVEAHLYFGLLPLWMAIFALLQKFVTGHPLDRRLGIVAAIGLFGAVYATGWLLPIAKLLPGFGYFRGPGRYGLLTTLAVALLSGSMLTRWTQHGRRGRRLVLAVAILGLTVLDLHWVSGHQWYTFVVSDPAISHRHESIVGRLLRSSSPSGPARLLAPGPNLASLTGIAVTPPYLGFGPDAYYLSGGRLPDPRLLRQIAGEKLPDEVEIAPAFEWLRDAGVTHILSMQPLPPDWPAERIWTGFDPLLNPGWARREPLYLYVIEGAKGRVFLEPQRPGDIVTVTEYRANYVQVEVEATAPVELVLADLPWHEWRVELDGSPVVSPMVEGEPPSLAAPVQRRVEVPTGKHTITWTYRPSSLWVGLATSAASLLLLAAGSFRLRNPQPPT